MKSHKSFTPWLMLAPALIWLAVFNLWPSINTVILSFTNVHLLTGGHFVGLHNYDLLWHDPHLWDSIVNSLFFVVTCVPFLTFLPLLLALLVQRNLPGIGFFRTVFYFPVIASAVSVALIWQWMLDDRGLINGVLQEMHIIHSAIPFLDTRWLLLTSVVMLTVWRGLGYYMIFYLSALGGVRAELHEAAAVDGANSIQRFWNVTVPGVRGTMMLVAVMISVSAMRIFSELYILGGQQGAIGGHATTLVMLAEIAATGIDGRIGYASAIGIFLFLLTIGPLLLLTRLNRNNSAEVAS